MDRDVVMHGGLEIINRAAVAEIRQGCTSVVFGTWLCRMN